MKIMRHAVILAVALGAVCVARAAERTGPAPEEVIFPRGSSVEADPAAEAGSTPAASSVSLAGGVLRTSAYVLVLGALVVGAWYLLKRGSLPRPFSKSSGRLQVLETRMLGNRQFLLVVEYDDAKMLLGVCPGRIDYLTPLAGHPLAGPSAVDDEPEPAFARVMEEARR